MDLEEPITFDNIQRCFSISICLVVLCEIYNITVTSEGFRHQLFARARISCSTLAILQRERSS